METKNQPGEKLGIHVAASRRAMGERAAADIAAEMRRLLAQQPGVRMIFAAAPSQGDMLAALREVRDIEWQRVTAFHMDEYLGLPPEHPQRFGNWLREAIFDRVPFGTVHLLDPGGDPEAAARDYAEKLNSAPVDIVCCGVGANGHIAFNDPPADFDDPLTVKRVELDARCRQQQVEDRCFERIEAVPTHALTLTVPALMAANANFCTVPGAIKREAVHRMLAGPIGPECPATILRRHPRCILYLDPDSARGVGLDGYRRIV
ncbi:MAG: glucosamine-6-phosphate deaminase [Acidobacteriota bacterium]